MPNQPAKPLPNAARRRKRRTTEEVADRILEAAGVEFERHGYSGATTAMIARRADVTEAQIFRFYCSKQELFRAAIFVPLSEHLASFFARNAEAMAAITVDEVLVRSYIGELLDFIEQHSRMFMSLIAASAYSPETTEGIGEMEGLRAYFDRGAAMMTRRFGEDLRVRAELMVRVSFAAVLANLMFKDWLFPAGLADRAAIRAAITEFVIDGIRANEN